MKYVCKYLHKYTSTSACALLVLIFKAVGTESLSLFGLWHLFSHFLFHLAIKKVKWLRPY